MLEATAAVRPEKELLLECAGTRMHSSCAARVKELVGQTLDWPYLFATALENGVLPLLYWQLQATCPDSVPKFWMEQLREDFERNARRNLFLTAELLRLLELFRTRGIAAIPYKGPALAAQAYGDLALRQFADLDIVVQQRDVAELYELLVAHGYRSEIQPPAKVKFAGRIPGQYQFWREAGPTILEVHTEATLRYFPSPLDFAALVGRLERVPLGGGEVFSFSVEDALPILCVHGSKHFWERLCWICDIAQLTQIPRGVNWSAVFECGRRLGAVRMLLLGLLLANELLGTSLPEPVLERVQADAAVRALGAQVRSRFFREGQASLGVAQRALFRARMRGNVLEGTRYVARLAIAPTEEDWSARWLGGPWAAALRPFRLLRKYGLGLGRSSANAFANSGASDASPWLAERMLELAGVSSGDVVYDLDCGDGRIVVMAAKRYGARGLGANLDAQRLVEAKVSARAEGVQHLVEFVAQEAREVNLSGATVVVLSPRLATNAQLGQDLSSKLPSGVRIVSYGAGTRSAIPMDSGLTGPPEKLRPVKNSNGEEITLYLWRIG